MMEMAFFDRQSDDEPTEKKKNDVIRVRL